MVLFNFDIKSFVTHKLQNAILFFLSVRTFILNLDFIAIV